MKKKTSIVLITNIPTPYRIPLFNLLQERLSRNGFRLHVIFAAKTYSRRKWEYNTNEFKFDFYFINAYSLKLFSKEKYLFTYSGILRIIKNINPALVIVSGFSPATLKIFLASLTYKLRYLIWSGSIKTDYRRDSLIRKIFRKLISLRSSGAIAYGSLAKKYLIDLGFKPDNVSVAINTVDTEFFRIETEKIRSEITLENKHHLTYLGELTRRKNVKKILKVIKELSRLRTDFILDIVGDGPEKKELVDYVHREHLNDFVDFHGYKQKKDIPYYFASSSCFLFQSDFDIWGLVLIEAMSAGVPCLASIHAGSTYDLIREGVNGYKIDFSDVNYSVRKIVEILDDQDNSKNMGSNASNFISEQVSLNKSVEQFTEAILKYVI